MEFSGEMLWGLSWGRGVAWGEEAGKRIYFLKTFEARSGPFAEGRQVARLQRAVWMVVEAGEADGCEGPFGAKLPDFVGVSS